MNDKYGKDYYIDKLGVILDFFDYRNSDLKLLLENSKDNNDVLFETIDKLYEYIGHDKYIKRKRNTPSLFYQKINELIPDVEIVYTRFKVKAFNENIKNLETKRCYVMDRLDYVIVVLYFAEQFAFDFIKAENIFCSKYYLRKKSKYIDFSVRYNPNTKVTYTRIIIPDELYISFSVCDGITTS